MIPIPRPESQNHQLQNHSEYRAAFTTCIQSHNFRASLPWFLKLDSPSNKSLRIDDVSARVFLIFEKDASRIREI